MAMDMNMVNDRTTDTFVCFATTAKKTEKMAKVLATEQKKKTEKKNTKEQRQQTICATILE